MAFGIRHIPGFKFWLTTCYCVISCKLFISFKNYLFSDSHEPGTVLSAGDINYDYNSHGLCYYGA